MVEMKYSKKTKSPSDNAQAIVEFAIIVPILIVLLIGIFEFGRFVFIYAAVNNASREAVRFGSAIGFQDNTYYRKYQYCSGIRDTAKRTAFLTPLQDSNIVIEYDQGPGTTAFDTCPVGTVNDKTIMIKMGRDRVKVTVSANYSPLTKLLPLSQRTIISSSSRTILGNAQLGSYP